MSLSSILQVGLSGVLSDQRALQTVSNNIANENTPGYVSETAVFEENPSLSTAYGVLGEGVNIASISRNFSSYAQSQLMNATSLASSMSGQAQSLDQLSSLFPVGSGVTGLDAAMQSFYGAFQTLSTNPSSVPDRQSVLSQAQSLTAQYQNAVSQIGSVQGNLVQQMQQSVATINGLSSQLASINQSLAAIPQGSPVPNSLLDSQAAALDSLSQQVGINTIPQSNGALIVTTKSGATLVDGSQSLQLAVQTGGTYGQPNQADIVYPATGQVLTQNITGGALGGTVAAQGKINTIQLQIGLLAQGIAAVTNTQQAMGSNLNGQLGGPIFTVEGPQVFPANTNQGNATITATVTDLATIPPTTFTLEYNGSQWNVLDNSTGESFAETATGNSLAVSGMTLTVSGSASTGDSFLLNPAGSTAGSFQTVMTDPSQVAAAFPYVASPGSISSGGLLNTNAGTETLSAGIVVSPSGSATSGTGSGAAVVPSSSIPGNLTVQFLTSTQFEVLSSGGTDLASGTWSGAGSNAIVIPYPAGSLASGSAMVFSWGEGAPVVNDMFTLSNGAPGNNANAISLSQAADQPVLSEGSVNQFVANMSNSYGNITQNINQSNTSAQTTLTQAQTALSNISGVNLNAEAALVVNYTQAYQAASAVIQASNTLFQSLLQSIGA